MTRTWEPARNHSWISGMRPCRDKIAKSRGLILTGADKAPGSTAGKLSDIVSFPTGGHSEARTAFCIHPFSFADALNHMMYLSKWLTKLLEIHGQV